MKPEEVIKDYFPKAKNISALPYGHGARNATYLISVDGENFILQKMRPGKSISIVEDIEEITRHLDAKKIITPLLIKTSRGALVVNDGDSLWRMLSYIPHKVFTSIESAKDSREAGELLGNFHTALLDLEYEFKKKSPHFHDTAFVMGELEQILEKNKDTEKYEKLNLLAQDTLLYYKQLPSAPSLPNRIIHGDLKITNVLFDESGERAIALVDLDTLMRSTMAVELGDALRSWCQSGGEDTEVMKFDKVVYEAALEGFFSTAKFLGEEEKKSISYGVKLITLELTARFIMDAFNESFFNLDSSKYKNLFEQNKKRAENQFAFFKDFSAQMPL